MAASLPRRLCSLLGIMLITLVRPTQEGGAGYGWGSVVVYVASYMHPYDSSANLTTVATVNNVFAAPWVLGSLIATGFYQWVGGRTTLAVGVSLIGGFVALASLAQKLYELMIVLAVAYGVGSAMVLLPCMFMSWGCLPSSKGLATGLVLLFFNTGSMLFALGFTYYINPDNVTPDQRIEVEGHAQFLFPKSMADKVPAAFLWCGVITVVVGGVGLLLTRDFTQRPDRKQLSNSIASKELHPDYSEGCPSLRVALHTSAYWVLQSFTFLAPSFYVILQAQFKNYGALYHSDDHYLSAIGSSSQFAGGLSRFLICWLTDFLPYRVLMLVAGFAMGALAATIHWVVTSEFCFALWVILVIADGGCIFGPAAIICGEVFGAHIGKQVYSLMGLGPTTMNFLSVPFAIYIVQPYGYDLGFYICAGCSFLATLIVSRLRVRYEWHHAELDQKLT